MRCLVLDVFRPNNILFFHSEENIRIPLLFGILHIYIYKCVVQMSFYRKRRVKTRRKKRQNRDFFLDILYAGGTR